jgi:hypothetical protein
MAGELARIIGNVPEALGGLLDEACDIRARGRGGAAGGMMVQVSSQLPSGGGMPPAGGGNGGNGGVLLDPQDLRDIRDYLNKLREHAEHAACNDGPAYPYPFCDPASVELLQRIAMSQCNKRFDDCYLMDIIRAIGDSSWPEIEDQIDRSEMYFSIVTTLVGAGVNAKGTATVFNPALPLGPGQSVLLVQDLSYVLPWYPRLLLGAAGVQRRHRRPELPAHPVQVLRRPQVAGDHEPDAAVRVAEEAEDPREPPPLRRRLRLDPDRGALGLRRLLRQGRQGLRALPADRQPVDREQQRDERRRPGRALRPHGRALLRQLQGRQGLRLQEALTDRTW